MLVFVAYCLTLFILADPFSLSCDLGNTVMDDSDCCTPIKIEGNYANPFWSLTQFLKKGIFFY